MNCFFTSHHLSAYVEKTLADFQQRQVEAHLEACEACRNRMLRLQEAIETLSTLPRLEVPHHVRAQVRLRLHRQEKNQVWYRRFVLSPPLMLGLAILSVAALLIYVRSEMRPLPPSTLSTIPAQTHTLQVAAGLMTPTPKPQITPAKVEKVLPPAPKEATLEVRMKVQGGSTMEVEKVLTKMCITLSCQYEMGTTSLAFTDGKEGRGVQFWILPPKFPALRTRLAPFGEMTEKGLVPEFQSGETPIHVRMLVQAVPTPIEEKPTPHATPAVVTQSDLGTEGR